MAKKNEKINFSVRLLENGESAVFFAADGYDLDKTFDCGQCFRFTKSGKTKYKTEYSGIAGGKFVRFAEDGESIIVIGATDSDAPFWYHYLGLDTDYKYIKDKLCSDFADSKVFCKAAEISGGIRILAQDRFETLCTFILSQNNNIPRIRSLVEALCKSYGEPVFAMGKTMYAFPSPERLAAASIDELSSLKMGYRARYIHEAANAVASGSLDLCGLNAENAREKLLAVTGIGEKVASCIRLFGIGDLSAFPVDVWIKRTATKYFDGNIDRLVSSEYGGVAQQYLFYYERYLGGDGG